MEFLNDIQRKVQDFASENASTLLTVGGVVGTVATAVLAGRASIKADRAIRSAKSSKLESPEHEGVIDEAKFDELTRLDSTERVRIIAPHFVLPVAAGGATIAAIVFANKISVQKAAALAAAYGLSQKQLEEYKEKVEEKLGGAKKDRPSAEELKEELAQERVNRTPGANNFVIVEGGDVLCFDEPTGRYFKSSMEKINRAVNKVNEEILHGESVEANAFYNELDLPPVTWAKHLGFNWDNLCEVDVVAVMNPDDEKTPMLSVNFSRMPKADYHRTAH